MPPLRLIAEHFEAELKAGFVQIRADLKVPTRFDEQVLAEASDAVKAGPRDPTGSPYDPVDRTELDLVTIDPPTSTDLDQAFTAQRTRAGYRVFYAIADVGAFVMPGSALDMYAREQGVTLYSPDSRASLHPVIINEDAASLLPGTTKPALVWQIDLDRDGHQTSANLSRATVRSRHKLSYRQAQHHIDNGTGGQALELLREIGILREQIEAERGAISLQLPAQEITRLPNGDYELHYDQSLPVEGWNAQISLMTGMAAGQIMIEAGQGLLRTLPPLHDGTISQVRRAAKALEIDWPHGESYPDRVRRLDPNVAREAALLVRAARSFRGAGYQAFSNGEIPDQPLHGAINAIYAHVTAPLRRVCDRFCNEILLAQCADRPSPAWALEALHELPSIMGQARQRDSALERATVDFVEAVALRSRIGETFDGVVLSHRRNGANVQLREPAVLAGISEQPEVGSVVKLQLAGVDIDARRVDFEVLTRPGLGSR